MKTRIMYDPELIKIYQVNPYSKCQKDVPERDRTGLVSQLKNAHEQSGACRTATAVENEIRTGFSQLL